MNFNERTAHMRSKHFTLLDVIMGAIESQIISLTIVYFVQAQTEENTKTPRLWPLFGEFTGVR